jgi:adenylyl-sulfate kinase
MSVKGVSSRLSQGERTSLLGHGGATLWFTGLPAAGKTTLTVELERKLVSRGRAAYRLDGDTVRRDLCGDLGFDRDARAENVRRVALVSRLLADAGVLALVALISPYTADRELARQLHDALSLPFFEIFVDTPIEVCQQRDPKGLYEGARRGEVAALTGVDDPYEPPARPDLRVPPQPLGHSVQSVLELLSVSRLIS